MENTRAIILAAGKGTRMASYSNKSPKSLLELKGEPLLTRQMRSMSEAGVKDFIIVGGYMFDRLREFVGKCGHEVKLLFNPFYAITNSIASLWFARQYLEGDVFITNADTYFAKDIYRKLMANTNHYVFGVDEGKKNDMDYRVTLADAEVLDMGKDIPDDEAMAEYIGMALIRREGTQLFRDLLERVVASDNYNLWWEDLFVELMAKGHKISYADVTGDLWFEIDEVKDYRRSQRYF
jgi:choline kinase